MDPANGWRKQYDSPGGANFSPHYESYIWAVYLWGYSRSGFAPLYDRSVAALTTMMQNYPSKWIPTANGIAMQRARIILPLAFLVRVNDTALHRQWLHTAIDGLLTRQHCGDYWCAFMEELSHPGWGRATHVPETNAQYGTSESPLNQVTWVPLALCAAWCAFLPAAHIAFCLWQENTDPVSDFLYTTNFALLGLHEAAAALGNSSVKAIEDRLADFIVRSQARCAVLIGIMSVTV